MSRSSVVEGLATVQAKIGEAARRVGRDPTDVRLVLVTKTVAAERVREAVEAGQSDLGENKVQEGRGKADALDRMSLATALDKRLQHLGRRLDVLVQVNTSDEASKYGLHPDEVPAFLRELMAFASLRPLGFMTLARFTPDVAEVRRCFRVLKGVRDRALQDAPQGDQLRQLSMGMSGDYEIAIEEGATIVRVGQAVFGPRPLPDSYYWPDTVAVA